MVKQPLWRTGFAAGAGAGAQIGVAMAGARS